MNLKPVYDAALAADAEVQRVMTEMLAAFDKGTEEGQAEALAMRPALDEAKTKAVEANSLYVVMRDASTTSDGAARNFVPVPGAEAVGKKVISRAQFEALDYGERHTFFKDGGTVVDKLPD